MIALWFVLACAFSSVAGALAVCIVAGPKIQGLEEEIAERVKDRGFWHRMWRKENNARRWASWLVNVAMRAGLEECDRLRAKCAAYAAGEANYRALLDESADRTIRQGEMIAALQSANGQLSQDCAVAVQNECRAVNERNVARSECDAAIFRESGIKNEKDELFRSWIEALDQRSRLARKVQKLERKLARVGG